MLDLAGNRLNLFPLRELGEYFTFLRTSPKVQTAYTDTLGDLCLGTLGSLFSGVLVAQLRSSATSQH